jgi:hypothetical protein
VTWNDPSIRSTTPNSEPLAALAAATAAGVEVSTGGQIRAHSLLQSLCVAVSALKA